MMLQPWKGLGVSEERWVAGPGTEFIWNQLLTPPRFLVWRSCFTFAARLLVGVFPSFQSQAISCVCPSFFRPRR
jgi:hypothetical protein